MKQRLARRYLVFLPILLLPLLAACDWLESEPTPELPPIVVAPLPTEPPNTPEGTLPPDSTQPPAPDAPQFATVVPEDLPGLETFSESTFGAPYQYFAAYPVIEGFPLLRETLSIVIAEERARFEVNRGPFTAVPAEAASPSFNVSYDFLVASGDVLGVRLHFYEFFGANGQERSAVYWFDLASGEALRASALFDGADGMDAVTAQLRDAILEGYRHVIALDQLERHLAGADTNLRAMGFTEDGDLLVTFDEYSIGPGALGAVPIVLPGEQVEPYLSDFGRDARAETLAPSGPPLVSMPPPGSDEAPDPTLPPPPPADGNVDCSATPCVALTFDDGPGPYTAELLDVLGEANVPATFFVLGISARTQPSVLARMVAEGHEIGNHTWDHKDLTTLGAGEVSAQWAETAAVITEATGVTPSLYRPPFGLYNDAIRDAASAPFVLWSVDPRDWLDRETDLVVERVLDDAKAGDIVLLHDVYESSVEAVPAIIEGLREQGFTLVTVSDLLGGTLVPGGIYVSR